MHHHRAVLVALVGDAAEMRDHRVVLGQEVAADQYGRAMNRRRLDHDHGGAAARPLAVVAEVAVARQPLMAHVRRVGAEDDTVLQLEMTELHGREEMRELGFHERLIPPCTPVLVAGGRIYTRARVPANTGPSIGEVRPDLDLRMERAMHRAFVGDLQEALTLLGIERTGDLDLALDLIDLALPGLAVRAVCRSEERRVGNGVWCGRA